MRDDISDVKSTIYMFARSVCCVKVNVTGNWYGSMSSNHAEAVGISHYADILEKGINQIILLPAMGK